jgi:fructokinase
VSEPGTTRIGVDLGGTKIEAIALDAAGATRARRRVATPSGDYAATIEAVAGLVAAIEAELGVTGTVGVGTPGTHSRVSGRMKNCNSTWLNGRPLREDLIGVLGRDVRIANDADCFALSEATDGAAAGCDVVFGVIIGTGTGAGIVVDGRLLQGPNGIAGEWGHNPLPWPGEQERVGPKCYCGLTGCIETYLSGPGLARDHALRTGQARAALEIAAAAEAGDEACRESLARYAGRLARALASVVNVLDPDAIVLGGGLSNVASLYTAAPTLWGRYVFSDRVDTRLLAARHGDSSGVRGAAWLWNV